MTHSNLDGKGRAAVEYIRKILQKLALAAGIALVLFGVALAVYGGCIVYHSLFENNVTTVSENVGVVVIGLQTPWFVGVFYILLGLWLAIGICRAEYRRRKRSLRR